MNNLLHFTADRDANRRPFDLPELIQEVCDSLAPQLAARGIDVELDVSPRATMHADREMLRRSLSNLVRNSLDAMPNGGQVKITSWDGPEAMELEIADSGPGFPEHAKDRLQNPLSLTNCDGTGQGLDVVQRVAEIHGGELTAMNCPEGGAAFTLIIPHLDTAARRNVNLPTEKAA